MRVKGSRAGGAHMHHSCRDPRARSRERHRKVREVGSSQVSSFGWGEAEERLRALATGSRPERPSLLKSRVKQLGRNQTPSGRDFLVRKVDTTSTSTASSRLWARKARDSSTSLTSSRAGPAPSAPRPVGGAGLALAAAG